MNPGPSTSRGDTQQVVSPHQLRPYPKAGECKRVLKKGENPMKSAVLMDTQVKNELEAGANRRKQRMLETGERENKNYLSYSQRLPMTRDKIM